MKAQKHTLNVFARLHAGQDSRSIRFMFALFPIIPWKSFIITKTTILFALSHSKRSEISILVRVFVIGTELQKWILRNLTNNVLTFLFHLYLILIILFDVKVIIIITFSYQVCWLDARV